MLADERARKREALLQATERDLEAVRSATRRDKRRVAGKDRIGLRVGKVVGKHKMAKHFGLEISEDGFAFRRNRQRIAQEAALDGIYVIRTSLPETDLGARDTVRAHVFLCMLAWYVEWHMRKKFAPVLFDDDDPAGAEAARASVVAPAMPSASARAKAASKRTPEGTPVHSFHTLLDDLAAIAKNRV